MDDQIYYVTYDPDAIWNEMAAAYIDAGGDILYPGDEKEMLMRGAQAAIAQVLAGVDVGIKMNTLRFAVGGYLDIVGEGRFCDRIKAVAAACQVEITFSASGTAKTIEQGTAITADGAQIYLLVSDVAQTGRAETVRVGAVCQNPGSAGNGLTAGTQMQLMTPNPAITSIYAVSDATGGQDKEGDEEYRERIRAFGLASVTTGPSQQYEAMARAVSTQILDAHAMNLGAGRVGVYLIFAEGADEEGLIAAVAAALNPISARPLTDYVTVEKAPEISYTLNVTYHYPSGSEIDARAIADAYQVWQDEKIGRHFNPDRLKSMLYTNGCTRVNWGDGSVFGEDGDIDYTTVEQNVRLTGTINLEGIEDG